MRRAFVVACLVLAISATSVNSGTIQTSAVPPSPPRDHESHEKLRVSVDPRIELLSVVQLLSGYVYGNTSLINTDATAYRRHLDVYFAAHRGHAAVKLFAKMYPAGFAFHIPPEAMLHFSNPPQLLQQGPIPEEVKRSAGGEQRLIQFISALRDFARATRFMAFYDAHRKDYQRMVDNTRAKTKAMDLAGVLEEYYGMKQHSYNVMLMPLAIELGYGPRVKRADGTLDIYQLIGRGSVKDGFPIFGAGGGLTLQNIVWHEMSHSFVNPLTEKYESEVMEYASLYAPISNQMKEAAYGTWKTTVNEHIVRALTSRLASREIGTEAGDKELQTDKNKGFIYIEALAQRLKEYESQRSKYQRFADFYPRLLDVFREIQEKKAVPQL